MNTNLQRLTTREQLTIAGVGFATAKTFTKDEVILQTYSLNLSMSKSRESSRLIIDGLWQIFLGQVQSWILDSSSKETTGQHQNILNDTQSGQLGTAANQWSGNRSL